MALNAGLHRAVHGHNRVCLCMGGPGVLLFGCFPVHRIGQGTYPVDSLGLCQHVRQSQFLRMQPDVARGPQLRITLDLNGIVLKQQGLGIHVVDGDGATGKTVISHGYIPLIPNKVHTRPGGEVKVSLCSNVGIRADDNFIGRPYLRFGFAQYEGAYPVSLPADQGFHIPLTPG